MKKLIDYLNTFSILNSKPTPQDKNPITNPEDLYKKGLSAWQSYQAEQAQSHYLSVTYDDSSQILA